MAVVSMKSLLESGVHFGHRTHRWNPHMKPYIFTERNGIHIINLQLTLKALDNAYDLIRDTVADGGMLLFVGTKRQAQDTIQNEASRCGMPYVNARWLGGMLTNYRTIRERISELERLERMRDGGEFERLTKKEGLMLSRKIEKLETRLSGIRNMIGLPDLLFAVDVRREETAIHEANLLEIPVIAMVDTNCDPRDVDYIIPSNDDAIRAIKLIVSKVADAVIEGKALRKEEEVEAAYAPYAEAMVEEAELTDEELLGEATLAKLREAEPDEAPEEEPLEAEPDEAPEEEPLEAEPDEAPEEEALEAEDELEEETDYESFEPDEEELEEEVEDEALEDEEWDFEEDEEEEREKPVRAARVKEKRAAGGKTGKPAQPSSEEEDDRSAQQEMADADDDIEEDEDEN